MENNEIKDDEFFGKIVSERYNQTDDKYMTPECTAFCEGYAIGVKKTTEEISNDIDEFYYMLECYDDYLKKKDRN